MGASRGVAFGGFVALAAWCGLGAATGFLPVPLGVPMGVSLLTLAGATVRRR